jgi:hypothetical protein
MKLTVIDTHLGNLGEVNCPDSDPADYEEALSLDKDTDAFVKRFAEHFAGDYPVLKEMLAVSFAAHSISGYIWYRHSWELMKWVLWWSEEKSRPANQSAA